MRHLAAVCVMILAAGVARAEPTVSHTIGAPHAPTGVEWRLYEDCRIESRAPNGGVGAIRRCAPGSGWRLHATSGAIIFPQDGMLTQNVEWAFAGERHVAVADRGRVSIVALPSGEARAVDFDTVVSLRGVTGLPIAALLVRTDDGVVAPLSVDGAVQAPLSGVDGTSFEYLGSSMPCQRAYALALIGAEAMANTTWREIVRAPAVSPLTCDRAAQEDVVVARDGAGGWRVLDNGAFAAVDAVVHPTKEAAIAAGRQRRR